jgi:hypothetical protein
MKAAGTVTDTDKILSKLHGISGTQVISYKIGNNGPTTPVGSSEQATIEEGSVSL